MAELLESPKYGGMTELQQQSLYIYLNLYLADGIIFIKYLLLIDVFLHQRMNKLSKKRENAYIQYVQSINKSNSFSPFFISDKTILITLSIVAGEKHTTNLLYVQNNKSENQKLKK